jgi:hypothetical protein
MLKLSGWPRLTWGLGPRMPHGIRTSGETQGLLPQGARRATYGSRERTIHHSPQPAPIGEPRASARQARGLGGPGSASARMSTGTERCRAADAQAGVPSAEWPRAQLAFKNSMVHGILQFTPRIAFRYVLHRCESRDIRCRESFHHFSGDERTARPWSESRAYPSVPWRQIRAGFVIAERSPPGGGKAPRGRGGNRRPGEFRHCARVFRFGVSTMILPQVHLRKPCYDFSFL